MTSLCRFCRKPPDECLEADKKLITPINPANKHVDRYYLSWRLTRIEKAMKYILGCYNPDTDKFYMYNNDVDIERLQLDTYLLLPKCVWESSIKNLPRARYMISKENIRFLPLTDDYITILHQLASDGVSLPILP